MAVYIFDTMDQSDATAFTSTDYIAFQSTSVANITLTDTPEVSNFLGTTFETITLADSTHSLTFVGPELSQASQNGHLVFDNHDALYIGLSGSTGAPTGDSISMNLDTAGHGAVAYGLAGDDDISAGNANDTVYGGDGDDTIHGSSSTTDAGHNFTESDFYMGGAGDDSIRGGDGNDHIYGNVAVGAAGLDDGNDTLYGAGGNDYINGNAGNDSVYGGSGNDKLFGGAGDDSINGDNGNDSLQGNKGSDTLFGGDGNDTVHGGADNDLLGGNDGHNQVFGELGNDTIESYSGTDTLSGGAGNDLFHIFDASNVNLTTNATAVDHDVTTVIADFTSGEDAINIGFAVDHIYLQTGVTFSSLEAAQTYAEGLMDHTNGTYTGEVAAIQVGSDTYLFYNNTNHDVTGADPAHSIDSVIKLAGVTATTITTHDFTF